MGVAPARGGIWRSLVEPVRGALCTASARHRLAHTTVAGLTSTRGDGTPREHTGAGARRCWASRLHHDVFERLLHPGCSSAALPVPESALRPAWRRHRGPDAAAPASRSAGAAGGRRGGRCRWGSRRSLVGGSCGRARAYFLTSIALQSIVVPFLTQSILSP